MLTRLAVKMSCVAISTLVTVAAVSAQAGDPGMVVVANGGGHIKDAVFVQGAPRDATFSFHLGFNKQDEPKGSFQYKIVVPGKGTTHGVSTQITNYFYGADDCPWVQMDGTMTFHAHWAAKPSRGEYFSIKTWDCDGLDAADSVQFWIWRSNHSARGGQTLAHRTDLSGGNVRIR